MPQTRLSSVTTLERGLTEELPRSTQMRCRISTKNPSSRILPRNSPHPNSLIRIDRSHIICINHRGGHKRPQCLCKRIRHKFLPGEFPENAIRQSHSGIEMSTTYPGDVYT